ncbi:hypothetical protein BHF71_09035 [Vulcanibacillus modesticaldus]|uniref:Uncharacterized protein n=1 Tax=Vulcanibacillus modesticaldus TaxID=337097 RepID=A0A1D2YUW9_9BACI|nr:hypothetical protein [Vulcanibacillus modesticaldus]OEF99445.1 hypothetical protein BHF71_09035 [Vulcanibacillus modesticaldus]
MKAYIIGVAMFVVFISFTIFQQDYNLYQEHLYNLKFVAEESAASAAQYIDVDNYAEGKIIFNRLEGIEAAEYLIIKQLKLDKNFMPLSNSYWHERIDYRINFFDESNSVFPFLYENSENNFVLTISNPTVVITINAGEPRYRLFNSLTDAIMIAVYEWKGR